jgi:hypothetical protein
LTPPSGQARAGLPVTFMVTGSPVAPWAGEPTGTVTILDGTPVPGLAPVDANGQAVSTLALAAGDHRLTVSYDGDFRPGISGPRALPVI